jgi:hypothetical protein
MLCELECIVEAVAFMACTVASVAVVTLLCPCGNSPTRTRVLKPGGAFFYKILARRGARPFGSLFSYSFT